MFSAQCGRNPNATCSTCTPDYKFSTTSVRMNYVVVFFALNQGNARLCEEAQGAHEALPRHADVRAGYALSRGP